MRKKIIPITIIIPIIVILIVSAVALVIGKIVEKNMSSKVVVSVEEYYGVPEDEAKLIVDGAEAEVNALIRDGEAYIPLSMAECLITRIYYDVFDDVIIYTTATEKYVYTANESVYTVNGEENKDKFPSFIEEGGNVFVSVKFVERLHPMEVTLTEAPYRLIIFENTENEYKYAGVNKNTEIRTGSDKKKPLLRELTENDKVYVLENSSDTNYVKVLTEDGIIGYVDIEKLAMDKAESKKFVFDRPDENAGYTSITKEEPIVMGWHQVTSEAANSGLASALSKAEGVNVVSPTWFSIADEKGEIASIASTSYVNKLHAIDIEVWGLINDFNRDIDYNQLFLSHSNRTNLINNIVYFIDTYNLDGINIDFENIKTSYAKGYIQFLRELSIVLRDKKKVFSIDNYIPLDFNAFYDIKEQGILADYLCIMAYDEHYSGSAKAGSVSSIGWVKKSIENTVEKAPIEKVIVGLPFYTRIWREKSNGTLTTEALGMDGGLNLVAGSGTKAEWNEETGQYYAEWKDGEDTMKIWLEEERSLKAKLKEIDRTKAAGVAFWKLGLERKAAWESVTDWLNK